MYSREGWYKKHLQSCGEFPLLFPNFANEVFNEQQCSFNELEINFKVEPDDGLNGNYHNNGVTLIEMSF